MGCCDSCSIDDDGFWKFDTAADFYALQTRAFCNKKFFFFLQQEYERNKMYAKADSNASVICNDSTCILPLVVERVKLSYKSSFS